MSNKICKKCEVEKPRTYFYKMSSPKFKEHWDCRDSYCKECRIEYGTVRRQNRKRLAVDYLGGKCLDCDLVDECLDVYDLHHRNDFTKEFSISQTQLSFDKIKPELDKCDLLCSNCHRRRHYYEKLKNFNREVALEVGTL